MRRKKEKKMYEITRNIYLVGAVEYFNGISLEERTFYQCIPKKTERREVMGNWMEILLSRIYIDQHSASYLLPI